MSNKNGQDSFATNPESKVRIKVINNLCISAATCVIKAPNTFDLDEDGIAYVKEGTWDDAHTVIEGARSCPTTAIIVEDLEGNQIYPPIG
jgi:ferredoxin